MKTFVLIRRDDQDFSTIPGEVVYIFDHINGKPDMRHIAERLEAVLDLASEFDNIVFNGPAYLIAMAGYFWFTQDDRKYMNMYTYDVTTRQYHLNPTLPWSK